MMNGQRFPWRIGRRLSQRSDAVGARCSHGHPANCRTASSYYSRTAVQSRLARFDPELVLAALC